MYLKYLIKLGFIIKRNLILLYNKNSFRKNPGTEQVLFFREENVRQVVARADWPFYYLFRDVPGSVIRVSAVRVVQK